jgi:hypothetical protein
MMSLAAKSARLRQAKEEAEREIADYRAQMEADFQKKLAEVCTVHLPFNLCLFTRYIRFLVHLRSCYFHFPD